MLKQFVVIDRDDFKLASELYNVFEKSRYERMIFDFYNNYATKYHYPLTENQINSYVEKFFFDLDESEQENWLAVARKVLKTNGD